MGVQFVFSVKQVPEDDTVSYLVLSEDPVLLKVRCDVVLAVQNIATM